MNWEWYYNFISFRWLIKPFIPHKHEWKFLFGKGSRHYSTDASYWKITLGCTQCDKVKEVRLGGRNKDVPSPVAVHILKQKYNVNVSIDSCRRIEEALNGDI